MATDGVGMSKVGMSGTDLARLRAIAEEGRNRPLLGGPSLIVWGAAIAAAALFNWLVLGRMIAVPNWSISLVWFGLMGGAGVVASRFHRGHADTDAALSNANRVSRAVWLMAGAFLGTLAVGLTLYAIHAMRSGGGEASFGALSVMAPVTFGTFGIALAATAVAGEARWLLRFAWASLAFTVVTAVLLGQLAQHLVMAAGAVAVGVLPGLRMLHAGADG